MSAFRPQFTLAGLLIACSPSASDAPPVTNSPNLGETSSAGGGGTGGMPAPSAGGASGETGPLPELISNGGAAGQPGGAGGPVSRPQ